MRLHNGMRRLIVNTASPWFRARRWQKFMALMEPYRGMRVIDLGGVASIWRFCRVPLEITIVNLDEKEARRGSVGRHKFSFVAADATHLPRFSDDSFDLAFSNSVIEHVGDERTRRAFADEVARLAPAYYVQTPSAAFPYEVHSGMPFWWWWPARWREAMIARWRRTNLALSVFVGSTTLVRSAELRRLFADGSFVRERFLGIPKSTIAYRLNRFGVTNLPQGGGL